MFIRTTFHLDFWVDHEGLQMNPQVVNMVDMTREFIDERGKCNHERVCKDMIPNRSLKLSGGVHIWGRHVGNFGYGEEF